MLARVALVSLLLILPPAILAAPAISDVSGELADGQRIVISGNSFGSGPTVEVYDDFESGTVGALISTSSGGARVGSWTSLTGLVNPRYGNVHSHSGSLASRMDMAQASSEYIEKELSGPVGSGGQLYVSWWLFLADKYPGADSSNGVNWKQMWIQGAGGTNDDDIVVPTLLSALNWLINGNNGVYVGSTQTGFVKGRWSRFSTWIHVGYNQDGNLHFWTVDSANGHRVRRSDDGVTILEPGGAIEQFRVNGWGRRTNGSHPTFDDIYAATGPNARARVEVCDNAEFVSSQTKNCTVCTTGATGDSWNGSQISCTLRGGSFLAGEDVWLFVIDGNGQVSPAISVGTWSESSNTAPPAPGNLRRTDTIPGS